MPKFVFGRGVFSTVNGRDRVQRQGERSFARAGFVPSNAVADYGPGLVAETFTWPPLTPAVPATDDTPEIPAEQQVPGTPAPGTVSPALTFCYTHADPAMVDLAHQEVKDAMEGNGWIRGEVGTGTINVPAP